MKANTIIVTGSAGLIGSETVKHFAKEGQRVVGIDNDMRSRFFGAEASTAATRDHLVETVSELRASRSRHSRRAASARLFKQQAGRIAAVVHTAAQPSHDWAARDPQMDFTVNANGTLNLLEAAREYCPEAPFVFTSTNKVYGDTPNRLPLRELEMRWEIEPGHEYEPGISETMSIDHTKHSLFGASKAAADLLVQEYGRYFGMPTVCFRGGCLTGPAHAGTELHGFLSYLMNCTVTGRPYRVFGYNGKQVRDNIHSFDLVEAFAAFIERRASAKSTTSAAAATAIARCARRSSFAKKSAAGANLEHTKKTIASAITSGGSATCGSSSSIIRNGNSVTVCAKFSKKFTKPSSRRKLSPNERAA